MLQLCRSTYFPFCITLICNKKTHYFIIARIQKASDDEYVLSIVHETHE